MWFKIAYVWLEITSWCEWENKWSLSVSRWHVISIVAIKTNGLVAPWPVCQISAHVLVKLCLDKESTAHLRRLHPNQLIIFMRLPCRAQANESEQIGFCLLLLRRRAALCLLCFAPLLLLLLLARVRPLQTATKKKPHKSFSHNRSDPSQTFSILLFSSYWGTLSANDATKNYDNNL